MKIKYKLIKEDSLRNVYKIDTDILEISGKTFQIKKSLSNLSTFLNKSGSNLIFLLNSNLLNNKCYHCEEEIITNRFERNEFVTYKFCDKCIKEKYHKLYHIKKCKICGNSFITKDKVYNTCGSTDCIDKNKRNTYNNIKNTHWSKSDKKTEIQNKKTKTRLDNDKLLNRKYIAWNKGKTGIYSKETIEKLRNAAIKQMSEGRIKKTGIEKKVETFLIENFIKYKYSYILKRRQYDFCLLDYDIIIECDGDYWHANPKFWNVSGNEHDKKELYETQKIKIIDDKIKTLIVKENNLSLLRFWEYDINNNFDFVKKSILEKINEIQK